ncbi:hypothetical protein AGMMS5026_03560 [Endomicrobiia bacterium]|nr:hypothetical protein AGMMS49523_04840 [Endomicrobiia bacterium]GHT13692.1 hypothetical protein AGMMS49571_07890 [Endomicrobiia bacterium]GHT19065.1 hypothetical protein AGMMS49929_01960 [Endomicrobiia bacterium]GHT30145.1 hypothetical protein AGMMS5026_03560 [Endomicrobiia bacterium]
MYTIISEQYPKTTQHSITFSLQKKCPIGVKTRLYIGFNTYSCIGLTIYLTPSLKESPAVNCLPSSEVASDGGAALIGATNKHKDNNIAITFIIIFFSSIL